MHYGLATDKAADRRAVLTQARARERRAVQELHRNGDTKIPSSSDEYGPWLDSDGDGIGCKSSS
ncbi:excalibur calcium-binding domain-containing protein [Mycobacterium sp. Y57]|nr:excalibur calcium-binding domain-containing protein [Mycolicibacterium xanthum]